MDRDPFDLVGDVLDGQFRVDSFVGEGVLSVVYRGHHIGVDAPVAIKCMNVPETLDPALADPLVRGLKEASRMHYRLARGHLDIAQTIASGSTIAPRTGAVLAYLVREWFDGESLASDLARRRAEKRKGRSLHETLSLLEPAFDALAYAHAQGESHLSVNPSNLFLARRPGDSAPGSLKVLDFGMARTMSALASQRSGAKPATSGLHLLVPAYAAPEQFDRTLGDAGPGADVYALALVTMEVLSDRVVMAEPETGAIIERALDPRRRPTPQSHQLKLPQAVDRALTRAMSRAPGQRQKNAAELLREIKNALRVPARTTVSVVPPRLSGPPVEMPVLPAVDAPLSEVAAEPAPPAIEVRSQVVEESRPKPLLERPRPVSRVPVSTVAIAPVPVVPIENRIVSSGPTKETPPPLPPLPANAFAALAVKIDAATEPEPLVRGEAASGVRIKTEPAPAVTTESQEGPFFPAQDEIGDPIESPLDSIPPPLFAPPATNRFLEASLGYLRLAGESASAFALSPRGRPVALVVAGITLLISLVGLVRLSLPADESRVAAAASMAPLAVATAPITAAPVATGSAAAAPVAPAPPAQPEKPTSPAALEAAPAESARRGRFTIRAAVNALDKKWREVAKCRRDQTTGKAWTTITFAGDGSVTKVDVGRPFTGTETAQCIADALGAVQIAPFADRRRVIGYRVWIAP
jgi:serine/threonine-protein kinase